MSAAATNGRLTRKTACQLACSISQPPATGPIAMPSPETPAQMPIAFARSPAGKTAVMIDSVEGMMNAPPTPMRARVAISISGEVASAERPEPRPKMARPIVSAALAAESVAERAGGEQQAGEDEHVRVDDPLQLRAGGAEVALERGSATLRMVLSSPMTSSEAERTTSIHQRRGSGVSVRSASGRLLGRGRRETRRYRFASFAEGTRAYCETQPFRSEMPERAEPSLNDEAGSPPGPPASKCLRCLSCRCQPWLGARRLRLRTACSGIPTGCGAWASMRNP